MYVSSSLFLKTGMKTLIFTDYVYNHSHYMFFVLYRSTKVDNGEHNAGNESPIEEMSHPLRIKPLIFTGSEYNHINYMFCFVQVNKN